MMSKDVSLVCYYFIPLSILRAPERRLCSSRSAAVERFAPTRRGGDEFTLAPGLIGPSRPGVHAFRRSPGVIGFFQSGLCY